MASRLIGLAFYVVGVFLATAAASSLFGQYGAVFVLGAGIAGIGYLLMQGPEP